MTTHTTQGKRFANPFPLTRAWGWTAFWLATSTSCGDRQETTTEEPAPACAQPADFDPDSPIPWSFCGCGEEDSVPFYRCHSIGGTCGYLKEYSDDYDITILGSTCWAPCERDEDCPAAPGADAVGGCVLRCDTYWSACIVAGCVDAQCPAGWTYFDNLSGCIPASPPED